MELLYFVQQDLQLVCWWQDGHSGTGRGKKDKTKFNFELTDVRAADALLKELRISMDFKESGKDHF